MVKKTTSGQKPRYETTDEDSIMNIIIDPSNEVVKLNKILAAKQKYDLLANRVI